MTVYDVYRHWDTDLRPPLIEGLKLLTEAQLHWKPAGWHSSIFDLAAHVVGGEWAWIHRNVLQKVAREERWKPGRFANLQELLTYWEQLHAHTVEWLKEMPLAHMSRHYHMGYADMPEASVQWIIHHVMEHEAHHRGQIFLLMRMQGVNPPET